MSTLISSTATERETEYAPRGEGPGHAGEQRAPLAQGGVSSWLARYWLPLVLAVELLGLTALAATLNIWQDEAFTLHSTAQGPRFALRSAIYFECQPPTYFVVLSLWRLVNHSLVWARLFSIGCILLAMAQGARISRRVLPETHPALLTLLVGLNPISVWSATEARCYAMVIALSAWMLVEFLDGYFLGGEKPGARRRYLVLALVALTTQYYLGFLLVANAAALLVGRRWRPLVRYVSGMALVGGLFTPMLWPLAGQFRTHTGTAPSSNHGAPLEALSETYWRLQDYAVPLPWQNAEAFSRWVVLRDWLCRGAFLVGVVTLLARRWNERQLAMVSILATQSAFFLALRWGLGPDFFIPRYTVSLLLPLLLVILSWAVALRWRPAVWLTVLVLWGFDVPKLYAQHSRLAKEGDWNRVARYLEVEAGPDEPILTFINHIELPVKATYQGNNLVIPLPRPLPLDHYVPNACVIFDESEVRDVLRQTVRPGQRFWLVTACTRKFQGIEPRSDLLENVLRQQSRLESERPFWGTLVRSFVYHD